MKSFVITKEDDGMRLSRFVEKAAPALGKGALYKALRTGVHRTLQLLAESVSLTEAQTRAGLHAFRQLGLIELSESPFRYTMLAAQKCVLGDSPVLSALRNLNRKE